MDQSKSALRRERGLRPFAILLLLLLATLSAPASAAGAVAGPLVSQGASQNGPGQEAPGQAGTPADGAAPAAAPAEEGGFNKAKKRFETEARGLFTDPAGTIRRWVITDGPRIVAHVLLFFFILLIAKVAASFAERMVRRVLDKSAKNASALFKAFVASTVSKLIFFVGLVLALQNIGLDVAPILAGLGVMGFIVGFALQDTLGNFAAGIMLLLYRPYDIGDFVEVAGKEGTVDAMTLVSTNILTLDNQKLTIPNGKIWGDVIRNATANDRRRTNEIVGISYDDDIGRAQEVAKEVVMNMEHVLEEPEPLVIVVSLGDSSVNLSIRAWFPTKEYFAACCEMRKAVKLRFDAENITIPYPQRDVHLQKAQDVPGVHA